VIKPKIIVDQEHKIYPVLYPEDRGRRILQHGIGTYYAATAQIILVPIFHGDIKVLPTNVTGLFSANIILHSLIGVLIK
jgi:hypothetical protein